jgi:6-phosphogluconolactonase (cycloisomerase 2 family)
MPTVSLYVGTYTAHEQPESTAEGLYRCSFDTASGRVSPPELVAKSVVSPSWLRWHPTMPVMYTTQETGDGSPSALVSYRLSQNGCEARQATNRNNVYYIPRVRSR